MNVKYVINELDYFHATAAAAGSLLLLIMISLKEKVADEFYFHLSLIYSVVVECLGTKLVHEKCF